MTNALNRGEVQIILAGETRTLKPSLKAFQNIGTTANYRSVCDAVLAGDISAISLVVRHGLDMDDAGVKALPELLFQTGLTPLRWRVHDFAFKLFNAGKSPEEVNAEVKAEEAADQGNAPAAG